jgi:hypothetical protein
MKSRIVCSALLLGLVVSVAAQAVEKSPQGGPGSLASHSYTLVVDPEGAKPGASQESLQYLVTRESAKQHVVYAFTSMEGRDSFVARHAAALGAGQGRLQEKTCADARFNKVAYGTGTDWLTMYCGQTNPFLSDAWNDVISYVEAAGSWTMLYKCYGFNSPTYNPSGTCTSMAIQGGTIIYDLNTYGFNNITSSIKVCPEGITFTECQSF